MSTNRLLSILARRLAALPLLCMLCVPVFSQDASFLVSPSEEVPAAPVVQGLSTVNAAEAPAHKFWDKENRILFASVAAGAAADFAVTHANLQGGGRELNPVVGVFSGSTAGLAVNFAGETAGTIGLCYVFHKTGHHTLERLVSFANLGSSGAAVAYGLAHR